MLELIKELRSPKLTKDGISMPPSARDLRAASTLERMFSVIKGLELSQKTMEKELSDAQITITKLQVALANRTKELEDAKKDIASQPTTGNSASTFADIANDLVDSSGTEVPH